MKSFFKYVLATITGLILLSVLVFALMFATISSFSKKEPVKVEENSILHIELNYLIPEYPADDAGAMLAALGGMGNTPVALLDMLEQIDRAAEDKNIKGIYLDLTIAGAGFARSAELRNALLKFKRSGKFIYAYSENYYPQLYYLASAADKVYLHPEGMFLFNGLIADVTFLKEMFEKLGIEMQVVKHGKYKGFTETFDRTELSEENRFQINAYLQSVYGHIISEMAASRKMSADTMRFISDKMSIRCPEDAVRMGLVDELAYRDELELAMQKKSGQNTSEKIRLISLRKYQKSDTRKRSGKDRIAIIYANGDIVSGKGDPETIGDQTLREALIKIRKDKNIKAVVLRVNSPGGSALASDVIHRELMLTKKLKPVIVSMGDVAASGGYYISSAADTILSMPSTITGSIGVFGVIPNAGKLLNDKLGIRMDYVGTGEHSDFGRVDRPMTSFERSYMESMIDSIYSRFLTVVGSGRKMSVMLVDSLAQGRVYTGSMALNNRLTDMSGGLQDAIDLAAKRSGITEYRISNYPRHKSPLEEILASFSEDMEANAQLKALLGSHYLWLDYLMQAKRMEGIQMRMPWVIHVH